MKFSPRQKEVLGLIAEGCCNKTIARRLDVSYATIQTHIDAIRGKLELGADGGWRKLTCFAARWADAQKEAA